MARYNVAAGNVASVRDQLEFSSAYMGWVLSAGSWAYAISGPFTGQITDRIGGRGIIDSLGWSYVFFTPGAVLLAMTLFIARYVTNSPTDIHYLTQEESTTSTQNPNKQDKKTTPTDNEKAKDVLFTPKQKMQKLMRNYTFLEYLAAVFFLCWARDGFLNWFLSFFDAVRQNPLTPDDTAIIGGAWTMGGFVGGILCGWLSDVVFHSDRVIPICIFSVLQAMMLGVIYLVSATCSVEVLGALIFLPSVFLLGNYTLLSYTVPSDLPRDIAAGASGIMTAVGYFSTGLSGVIMGSIISSAGYFVWALSLMLASILTGVFTKLGSHFSSKKTSHRAVIAPLPPGVEERMSLSPDSSDATSSG
ncbi:hypothetical protein BBJ29_003567 [Phytophthora kernoviae]|uniref:Major facilitator superfamily (MFS) profile domain-containing protein n=1 Tax=Phytophthora kernoviae TaxID=325452 RepID=A0A3F2S3B7_9STRA|nr:hypothetical protein BBJ29_003567 [Phytophthora kernoviae]RLN68914.1 hypothetical protein BBP00_00000716 [Phytophthora kernoviae]